MRILKELNLSELKVVMFKGGEPMLNEETLEALRYFDELNLLSNLEIIVFTNGTIIHKEILSFLDNVFITSKQLPFIILLILFILVRSSLIALFKNTDG